MVHLQTGGYGLRRRHRCVKRCSRESRRCHFTASIMWQTFGCCYCLKISPMSACGGTRVTSCSATVSSDRLGMKSLASGSGQRLCFVVNQNLIKLTFLIIDSWLNCFSWEETLSSGGFLYLGYFIFRVHYKHMGLGFFFSFSLRSLSFQVFDPSRGSAALPRARLQACTRQQLPAMSQESSICGC